MDYAKAQVDWINAIVDYNLAEIKLLKVMGIINIERIEKGVNKEELLSLEDNK